MSEVLRLGLLAQFPELVHGFSERALGSVHPEEAGGRHRLAESLGIAPGALVPTQQMHGDRVVAVPGPEYGCTARRRGVDGLVTAMPGFFLLGYFADCVPLLAYDPVRRAVGLAHAGWRGTLRGIAGRLVQKMAVEFSTRPEDLVVGLGPSIGPCCYEVGPEVVAGVRERLPRPAALLRPNPEHSGHAWLDLWEANRQLLQEAGVPEGQIEVAGLCTACHVERFFSFRREGRLNGLFGAVIGLREG